MSAVFFLLARLPVLFFVAMPLLQNLPCCTLTDCRPVFQSSSAVTISLLQRSSICIQFSNHQTTDGLGRLLAEHVRP